MFTTPQPFANPGANPPRRRQPHRATIVALAIAFGIVSACGGDTQNPSASAVPVPLDPTPAEPTTPATGQDATGQNTTGQNTISNTSATTAPAAIADATDSSPATTTSADSATTQTAASNTAGENAAAEVTSASDTVAPSGAGQAGGPQVQGVAVPALGSGSTPYGPPTDDTGANWSSEPAHSYPAVDIFVPGSNGCGGDVTAPVNGIIVEVRTVDSYDEGVDNPATRGGKSVAMVGDDGVRYYMSHFDEVGGDITAGTRVQIGQRLGSVGTTGRSGACHIHFGISPPCEGKEWSVRRGSINPIPYIDDWRNGGQRSPVEEVQAFVAANPNACAEAEADPNAADS